MSGSQKILSAEQSALVAEICETYGVEPDEILFFGNDPKPFLTYEATCVLCNQLTDLHDINIEPVQSFFIDSSSARCTLKLANGDTRSAVGVVNVKETIDGKNMGEQQILLLANSRAIRNALRTAGIDLLKLHRERRNAALDFKPKSNFASLLGRAHALGKSAGIIVGDDKTAWRTILQNRYGVTHSNQLSEENLADFVAVLSALVPQPAAA